MKRQAYIVKPGKMYYDSPEELEKKLNDDCAKGYEFDRIIPSNNGDIGFYIYKENQNLIPTEMMFEDITEGVTHSTYLTVDQLKLISLSKKIETECNVYVADVTVNYNINLEEVQATVDAYFEDYPKNENYSEEVMGETKETIYTTETSCDM